MSSFPLENLEPTTVTEPPPTSLTRAASGTQLSVELALQPTPPPSPSPENSIPHLQERLWNDAYDELKSSQTELVATYEEHLCQIWDIPEGIAQSRETRCPQMRRLVEVGLEERHIDLEWNWIYMTLFNRVVKKDVQNIPGLAIVWVTVYTWVYYY